MGAFPFMQICLLVFFHLITFFFSQVADTQFKYSNELKTLLWKRDSIIAELQLSEQQLQSALARFDRLLLFALGLFSISGSVLLHHYVPNSKNSITALKEAPFVIGSLIHPWFFRTSSPGRV